MITYTINIEIDDNRLRETKSISALGSLLFETLDILEEIEKLSKKVISIDIFRREKI